MKYSRLAAIALPVLLASCSLSSEKGTLAELRDVEIDIKDEKIDDGLEKAMQSYKQFLDETPESAMTPEAIRRLADLKVEKEYGLIGGREPGGRTEAVPVKTGLPQTAKATVGSQGALTEPERFDAASAQAQNKDAGARSDAIANVGSESDRDFERRATEAAPIASSAKAGDLQVPEGGNDLAKAGPLEAIALYKKLLAKYPMYERNDQVLYQMSRAYEELGEVEEAMNVMNRMVQEYPLSRYTDEVQFRRGEYFFMRKKYRDAENAYTAIVNIGVSSSFYELGLYKLGWAFYKQGLYEEALHKFVALLDHKVSVGYDFEQQDNKAEKKRVEDTYRVISLSFSNLGGPEAVVEYFGTYGARSYESDVYSHLGEFYVTKRRFQDAANSYKTFIKLNPFHKVSPHFHVRVIDIYGDGGFPLLVIESKKEFARTYGLKAEYWQHFDVNARADVVGYLKSNLKDLANYYHALYQNKKFAKEKEDNYREALLWYREFLGSFPQDADSPPINYALAELLLEHNSFGEAALEFEQTAYGYPLHDKSSAAGYTAIIAHRKNLDSVAQEQKNPVKRDVIRSSLKFVDTFPTHEKADVVLGAATDDLYEMKDYPAAIAAGRKLVENYPGSDRNLRRSAWLVVAHSSFELAKYKDAEEAYLDVLSLTGPEDKSRPDVIDNLAASIYKQGEEARTVGEHRAAADHFLRISRMAPTSKIRPVAEYDAAASLIQLKDWEQAANVLSAFRANFPGHELQSEVTKKIAYVYKEAGKLGLAASEYERIETESKDEEVRRDALLMAADLYEQAGNPGRALVVYRRYVDYFPRPLELALETRNKIAQMYKANKDEKSYLQELRTIVAMDGSGGSERTDRTRYLAANAGLVLTELLYADFANVKLVKPLEKTLRNKQATMKAALDAFGKLVDYEVADVTAASTYYMAEIYYGFSRALMTSERPDNLSPMELEQYELAIEEKAYPFEEKAIGVHEKNVELLTVGIYNAWVEKSIAKLATLMPARYARKEESTGFLESVDTFVYSFGPEPVPGTPVAAGAAPAAGQPMPASQVTGGQPASNAAAEPVEPEQAMQPEAAAEPAEPEQAMQPEAAAEPVEPEQAMQPEAAAEPAEPEQAMQPEAAAEPVEPEQAMQPEAAAEPAEPEQAMQPEATAESVEPEQAMQPEAAPEPAEPEQAMQPEATAEPADPEQAMQPEAAAEPADPEQTVQAEGNADDSEQAGQQ